MLLGDLLLDARRAAVLLDAALLGHIEATGPSPEAFARSAVVSFERTASGRASSRACSNRRIPVGSVWT